MAKKKQTEEETQPFALVPRTIRVPKALWDVIDQDAVENRRSSAAHTWWLLEQIMKERSDYTPPPTTAE